MRKSIGTTSISRARALCALMLSLWFAPDVAASIEPARTIEYRIEAKDLGDALNEFALQSQREILFDEGQVAGIKSQGVAGSFELHEALERLLAGTDLRYRVNELDTILVGNILTNGGNPTMTKKTSSRSLLATVVAAAAIGSGEAVAEEAAATGNEAGNITEEIVVYGIRGSLQQSLERKRNADHFVDAITAEDIGAFPDQNLAEALQRVSGVGIDRKEGEGTFVSVRGLGPQFVQTTANGRVATSNVNPGGIGTVGNTTANAGSRVVGFDQFQGGLVQAVEVYKSPRADHVEGGLGGVIEVKPRRPLDLGERHVAFSASTTYLELSDDWAPGLFGLYSDTFADDTFGFMVSAQWDDRTNRTDAFRTNGGYSRNPVDFTIDGQDVSAFHVNGFNGVYKESDRERLNISSALQFRPSDRVDISVDALYTEMQIKSEEFWWASYRASGGLRNNITDATVVSDGAESVLQSYSTTNANSFIQYADEEFDTETWSLGANLNFQATDRLNLDFDIAYADTDSPNDYREHLIRYTGLPATVSLDPLSVVYGVDLGNPDDYVNVKMGKQAHEITDEIFQLRGDVTYEFDDGFLDTVQFGARYSDQQRDDQQRFLVTRAFTGDPLSDFGGPIVFPVSDFGNELDMNAPASTRTGLVAPNLDIAHQVYVDRADEVLNGRGFCGNAECSLENFEDGDFQGDLDQQEKTTAFYGMLTFSGDMGSVPFSGNVGVRYVDTEVDVTGFRIEVLDIDFSDPSQPQPILSPAAVGDASHDYDEWLPSLNLKFDLREDLLLRASVGRVMSRANFMDTNPNEGFAPNNGVFTGGNPQLDPVTAWQYDLAVEWYFAEYSIVSVGLFHKDGKGFIQDGVEDVVFPGIIDPDTGQPFVAQRFVPVNGGDADLTGVELSYQQTFAQLPGPWDGLGLIANYTYIDSNNDFENENTGATFGIPGLSENTFNLSVFYEKNRLSARVAWNYRDEFLDQVSGFGGGHPLFVKSHSQIDASVNYHITDSITLGLEGINLTDENVETYVHLGTGSTKWFDSEINTGPRYQANLRWKL